VTLRYFNDKIIVESRVRNMADGFMADPERVMDKGAAVKSLADACLDEFDNLESETTKIGNAWDDSASKAYINQIKSYRSTFLELQTKIDYIGQVLDRHGNRLAEDRDGLSKQAEDL
jgi:uncharacterized protein YukE